LFDTRCTIPTIEAGIASWTDDGCNASLVLTGTNCTIEAAVGYACTSPGLCTNGSFANEGSCIDARCTVPTISEGILSWNNDDCASGAVVLDDTFCKITAEEGYDCTSPGRCVEGAFNRDGGCIDTRCTIPTIESSMIASWSNGSCGSGSVVFSGTDCTIEAVDGYTCTSPGLCTDGLFTSEGSCRLLYECSVPSMNGGVDSWNVDDCANGLDVESGTTCTATAKEGFTCKSPGLCTDGSFRRNNAACTDLRCTVPTITDGVALWSGDRCTSGATTVLGGTICTIEPMAGYGCTSPGLCTGDATFAQEGSCALLCTVPEISNGVASWGDSRCASGATNITSGTRCNITAASGFDCVSPGLCTNGAFTEEGSCKASSGSDDFIHSPAGITVVVVITLFSAVVFTVGFVTISAKLDAAKALEESITKNSLESTAVGGL